MELAIDAMRAAFNVLTAITERRTPDEAELSVLRENAPLLADAPADELACDVIQQALRRRALVRAKGAVEGSTH